jgi:amino acid permease
VTKQPSKLSREQMISSIAAWGVSFARHLADEEFQTSGHGDNTTTTKRSSQQKIQNALMALFFIGFGISYLWIGGEDLQDRLHSEARAQMMIEEVK